MLSGFSTSRTGVDGLKTGQQFFKLTVLLEQQIKTALESLRLF